MKVSQKWVPMDVQVQTNGTPHRHDIMKLLFLKSHLWIGIREYVGGNACNELEDS